LALPLVGDSSFAEPELPLKLEALVREWPSISLGFAQGSRRQVKHRDLDNTWGCVGVYKEAVQSNDRTLKSTTDVFWLRELPELRAVAEMDQLVLSTKLLFGTKKEQEAALNS
jgi:hypothetical protein